MVEKIGGGYFTNADGEVIKLAAVIAVEPAVGRAPRTYYEVNLLGNFHVKIKENYLPRAQFIEAWKAA